MPNQRDLQLERYDIDKYRYRELKYFCLQYDSKKERIRQLRIGLKAVNYTGGSKTNKITSSTENVALKIEELQKDIELIEQTAIEADSSIYQQIITNVTQNIPYEYLDVPCGRRQFYQARWYFFFLLSFKK